MAKQNKEALLEIERLLKRYRNKLAVAADTIRNENVSNYPIFVASKTAVEIGVMLFPQGQLPDDWIVTASSLEEFHVRKIIDTDKIDDFRDLFRERPDEICVFVFYTEGSSKFVFIPS
jgi:hypothetical protein